MFRYINNNVIKKIISKFAKTCPKCGEEHFKMRAAYCSRSCANSRDQSKKKKAQPTEKEKVCPKCGKTFTTDKRNRFCSNKCAKSREKTAEQRRRQSKKIREWKQTDLGEDNSFNILKNKKIPPNIPHPNDPGLRGNQFSDGEVLWNADESGTDWEAYYGWK